uniref:Uncharacterized protein n=1 Tax=Arundo donax TaxID=35708 RepID=A0A0A9ESW9_ARUDO
MHVLWMHEQILLFFLVRSPRHGHVLVPSSLLVSVTLQHSNETTRCKIEEGGFVHQSACMRVWLCYFLIFLFT